MAHNIRWLRLEPPPPWAAGLLGSPVEQALVGALPAGLVYEFSGEGRALLRVLLPLARGATDFAWNRAKLRPGPGNSTGAGELAQRLRTHTASLRADAPRHAWLVNLLSEGQWPTDYPPTPREQQLASLADGLGRSGALEAPTGEASDDFLAGLGTYAQIVNRQWATLFRSRESDAPEWIAPALALVHGDVEELQRLAREATASERELSCLDHLAATVFKGAGFLDEAATVMGRVLPHLESRRQADLLLELGQLLGEQGKRGPAQGALRRAVLTRGDDAELVRRAAIELCRVDAFDDAYLALEQCSAQHPDNVRVGMAFVELLLFAGEHERALACLEHLESRGVERADLLRCRGAIAVELGHYDEAVRLLTELIELAPGDAQGRTWLSEALIRSGDLDAAVQHHREGMSQHGGPAHVLVEAILAGSDWSVLRELFVILEQLGEELDIPEGVEGVDGNPARPELLRVLSTFRGSRGDVLVRVDAAKSGPTGVSRVRLRQERIVSSRNASAAAVKDIVRQPREQVFATFEELIERYPESAHPHCYRGEVHLWLGDYASAMADFDAALERHFARWGFIGRAAVHILEGRYPEAVEQVALCREHFEPIPSATTHIYLGEMHRREGQLDVAIERLEESLRVKPGRMSGWLNLALARESAGHSDRARTIFERVQRQAPRLLWDARRAVGEDGDALEEPIPYEAMPRVFEAALTSMRGNRSSHCVTYFDPDGVFRRVHDIEHWSDRLSRLRVFPWLEARRRLVAARQ